MKETLDVLYNAMAMLFVLSTMISMGLSLTISQITGPLRNARFVIMGLLANFIIVPIVAIILTLLIPMDDTLITGLILVAFAAGAPGLPKLAQIAKVDAAAATSLMVLLVVATIIIMPIALPLLIPGISVTFWDIASGLIIMLLIPLGISLLVRSRWEEIALSAQPYFTQASSISLLIMIVLMLVLNFQSVISLFGSGGLLASAILVIVSLAAGYLLGGPGESNRWVQSLGAGQRATSAAMVVAATNFGNQEIIFVVVFSLITMIIVIPLAGELDKRRAKNAEVKEESDIEVAVT